MEKTGIGSLPNEILIKILSLSPTSQLLTHALISHHIHDLIISVLHQRLLAAASLKDRNILLECCSPSTRYFTPSMICNYLYTDSYANSNPNIVPNTEDNLTDTASPRNTEGIKEPKPPSDLANLRTLYTHFRPLPPSPRKDVRHPAGGFVPSVWNTVPAAGGVKDNENNEREYITREIELEVHELFTQLCMFVNMVKPGPRSGLFTSSVALGLGTPRVFRPWLEDALHKQERGYLGQGDGILSSPEREGEGSILWADTRKHVGLRVKNIERPSTKADSETISYTLEFEDLIVRTSRLLFGVEEAIDQEMDKSKKVTVIGSWN